MKIFLLSSLIFLVAACQSTTKTYQSKDGSLTITAPPSKYNKVDLAGKSLMEKIAWEKAYKDYGDICLQELKAGQQVPRDMSVETTKCFNNFILKHVKPVSILPKEVVGLTKSNLYFAEEYETTNITFEEYQKNLIGARNFYLMLIKSEHLRAN